MVRKSWSDDEFVAAVKNSTTVSQVLRKLGLAAVGGNYKTFKYHASRLGCSLDHFVPNSSEVRPVRKSSRSLSDVLVNGISLSSAHLKARLTSEGILADECSGCSLKEWRGKPLVLHLDHINGDNLDNRIENLRLLCPNCHSQTSTYCGRNAVNRAGVAQPADAGALKALSKDDNLDVGSNPTVRTLCIFCGENCPPWLYWHRSCGICADCGSPATSLRCRSCAAKLQKTRIEWPSVDFVAQLVEASSYVSVAKMLGVTDKAVRKFLIRNGRPVKKRS